MGRERCKAKFGLPTMAASLPELHQQPRSLEHAGVNSKKKHCVIHKRDSQNCRSTYRKGLDILTPTAQGTIHPSWKNKLVSPRNKTKQDFRNKTKLRASDTEDKI